MYPWEHASRTGRKADCFPASGSWDPAWPRWGKRQALGETDPQPQEGSEDSTWDSLCGRASCPACSRGAGPPRPAGTRRGHSWGSPRASTGRWPSGSSGPRCSAGSLHMSAGMGGSAAPHPLAPWKEGQALGMTSSWGDKHGRGVRSHAVPKRKPHSIACRWHRRKEGIAYT